MDAINILTQSPYFILFLFVVIAGVLISVISSFIKKSGEVALEGAKIGSNVFINTIKFIFITIYKIIQIIFLALALIMAYVFRKK